MPTTPNITVNGQPLFEQQLQALSEGRDGNGVAGQTDLKVTDGSGDNESDIASGTAYYDGSTGSIGGTKTKTHSDGDANNDRWDLLAFDVSGGSVVLREGTAETNPTPPDLQSNEVLLAVVYVESQQTDFGSDDIVNFRVLGGTGITGSDDGSEKVGRVADINAADGIEGTDGGGGVLKLDIEPADFAGNGVEDDGSDNIAIATDAIQTDELDLSITPTWTGKHQFGAGLDIRGDLEDDTTTIWDTSGGHIEQSVLENDTITRTAGTGLTYSSGSAGTALGGSATIGISTDGVSSTEIASDAVGSTQLATDAAGGDAVNLSDIAGDNITVDGNNDELDTPAWSTVTKSSNYTASNYENVLVDASSSAVTVTLPAVATDLMVTVKATDATNTVTIATPNAETIDGDSNRTIDADNVALTMTSDGSNYFIV